MDAYIEDKLFERVDFTKVPLEMGAYEHCRFVDCDFSGADLSNRRFSECVFAGCNLTLAVLGGTAFRDVQFTECKMWGLRFEHCSKFGQSFRFDRCSLNHSSFYQGRLKGTTFKDTQLHEVDFTECDLTQAVFDTSSLHLSRFDRTILEKADLRSAVDYSIDPESNRIKKAKFALLGLGGLLEKYDIVID
jgi:uncharacterized protein YjbI with pentapeptide repeats